MLEKVREILSRYTQAAPITEDSELQADLGLTSFDLVSIVTEFEDTFEIEVSDRELSGFITVRDILDFLKERAAK